MYSLHVFWHLKFIGNFAHLFDDLEGLDEPRMKFRGSILGSLELDILGVKQHKIIDCIGHMKHLSFRVSSISILSGLQGILCCFQGFRQLSMPVLNCGTFKSVGIVSGVEVSELRFSITGILNSLNTVKGVLGS